MASPLAAREASLARGVWHSPGRRASARVCGCPHRPLRRPPRSAMCCFGSYRRRVWQGCRKVLGEFLGCGAC